MSPVSVPERPGIAAGVPSGAVTGGLAGLLRRLGLRRERQELLLSDLDDDIVYYRPLEGDEDDEPPI